jgi:hypothetical protein
MKMKIFEEIRIKLEQSDWLRNPDLGLPDSPLEAHPELLKIVEAGIHKGEKQSFYGRQDMPGVEQTVRVAIHKGLKELDYRELEYRRTDSRICEQYVRIDPLRPFSFQVYQKYISKIRAENLNELRVSSPLSPWPAARRPWLCSHAACPVMDCTDGILVRAVHNRFPASTGTSLQPRDAFRQEAFHPCIHGH